MNTCTQDEESLHEFLVQEDSDTSCHEVKDTNGNGDSSSDNELQASVTQGSCSTERRYVRRVRSIKTNQNPAYSKRCTINDVQKVAMIDYCNKKCCQMADQGKIMETRLQFWGQGYSQRATYLYDSISMAF